MTGHEDPAKDHADVDWGRLATAVDTLVVLMGAQSLPRIAAELVGHGRSPDTPVALIRWGTTEAQEVTVSTLGAVVTERARGPGRAADAGGHRRGGTVAGAPRMVRGARARSRRADGGGPDPWQKAIGVGKIHAAALGASGFVVRAQARSAAKFDSAARRRLGSSTEGAMKTLPLAVLLLLASAGSRRPRRSPRASSTWSTSSARPPSARCRRGRSRRTRRRRCESSIASAPTACCVRPSRRRPGARPRPRRHAGYPEPRPGR